MRVVKVFSLLFLFAGVSPVALASTPGGEAKEAEEAADASAPIRVSGPLCPPKGKLRGLAGGCFT